MKVRVACLWMGLLVCSLLFVISCAAAPRHSERVVNCGAVHERNSTSTCRFYYRGTARSSAAKFFVCAHQRLRRGLARHRPLLLPRAAAQSVHRGEPRASSSATATAHKGIGGLSGVHFTVVIKAGFGVVVGLRACPPKHAAVVWGWLHATSASTGSFTRTCEPSRLPKCQGPDRLHGRA